MFTPPSSAVDAFLAPVLPVACPAWGSHASANRASARAAVGFRRRLPIQQSLGAAAEDRSHLRRVG